MIQSDLLVHSSTATDFDVMFIFLNCMDVRCVVFCVRKGKINHLNRSVISLNRIESHTNLANQ